MVLTALFLGVTAVCLAVTSLTAWSMRPQRRYDRLKPTFIDWVEMATTIHHHGAPSVDHVERTVSTITTDIVG